MEAVLRNEPNEAGSGFRGRLTRSSSARLIDVELLRLNSWLKNVEAYHVDDDDRSRYYRTCGPGIR